MKKITLLLVIYIVLPACTVNEVITAEETELIIAEAPPEEGMLLDIGIIQFADGVAEDNDSNDTQVFEDIRAAESRYLAYHLKTTLQGTGHWGAVRVIPSSSAYTDVIIKGEIEESDGEYVTLEVVVGDARGQTWYSKSYTTQTGVSSYSINRDRRLDPYQKIFNDIANDLNAHVEQMPPKSVTDIQQVSELQFFADMSPDAYSEHLA